MLRLSRNISYSKTVWKSLYSSTLQLPKTSFGPKIPKGEARKELLEQIGPDLYAWQQERESFKGLWTLHDGPPYSNGDLHLGHALNKTLKDIVNRFELIYHNKKVNYTPGWDCHGLPIEMKALASAKNPNELKPTDIRKSCRDLALFMIGKQQEQFKEFGIMANFDDYYVTLKHKYETDQLQVFVKLMENGLLSRQLKPVWWGCETKTALAEAELDYKPDHVSVASYIKFPVVSSELYDILNNQSQSLHIDSGDLHVLIWTSTGWTIPANKAICIHKDLDYTLIYDKQEGSYLIVAKDLAQQVCELNENYAVHPSNITIKGKDLIGYKYVNPAALSDEEFPILHGNHVTSSAGTGLVHTAPAHGADDYLIGCTNNLTIASAVNEEGKFIISNLPPGFLSLDGYHANRKDGVWKCLNMLSEHGMIYHIDKKYKHSYPYDWRSNTPVLQRATPQWFISVGKIKPYAIEAINKVDFLPATGKNRLTLFISNRNEWCISRQRVWGVPIPVLYNKDTSLPLEDIDVIKYTVSKIAEYGTDSWFEEEEDVSRWLPESLKASSHLYYKGKDTMDVWFDSGTSWTTLGNDPEKLALLDKPLADVYLEGSDQHRGWFQSSLLNKIIASGKNGTDFKSTAPYHKIITHGFILDSKNNKMSKSKGNVISPKQIIEGGGKPLVPTLGVDGLRLWVASSNFTQDVSVTSEILSRVFESIKKYRVTFKFILGNLSDFDDKKMVNFEELGTLDQYVLSRLHGLQKRCIEHYENHNFAKVVGEINTHISADLSAQYFDISKDCLYTDKQDSFRRRRIQTVLCTLFKVYVGLLAPIQPMLVQEAWNAAPASCKTQADSPFKVLDWNSFYQLPDAAHNPQVESDVGSIWRIRDTLYKSLEALRLKGAFKNKLELLVNFIVPVDSKAYEILKGEEEMLEDYFLLSKATINEDRNPESLDRTDMVVDSDKIEIEISHAKDHKCPRCWKYVAPKEDELCHRCDTTLSSS